MIEQNQVGHELQRPSRDDLADAVICAADLLENMIGDVDAMSYWQAAAESLVEMRDRLRRTG